MKIDLTDPSLFGNDAGEDEDPKILSSYFVSKPAFRRFFQTTTPLAIIRARKGLGKSALLKMVEHKLQQENSENITVYVRGSDLTRFGEFDSPDPAFLINQWQQCICAIANVELAKSIRFAYDDTSMMIVESAEISGFRGRNFVGALVDRFRGKLHGFENKKLEDQQPAETLKRYADKNTSHTATILVDDIDATFINTPQFRLKISTFFSACRSLISSVEGLNIRASVRTDVWGTVRRFDESLDKCEQYISDISWTAQEACRILASKIASYIRRTNPTDEISQLVSVEGHEQRILQRVFTKRMDWGGRSTTPDVPIRILSAGRPRWAGQLCRLAGGQAIQNHHDHITVRDIIGVMNNYGGLRLDDLYREHRHQFGLLEELIESFSNWYPKYTTTQLIKQIETRFLQATLRESGSPTIDGHTMRDPIELAHLLYKIGFILGRDDDGRGGLRFIKYEDRPSLLRNRVNPDDGLTWEIHPSFRNRLRLRGFPGDKPMNSRSTSNRRRRRRRKKLQRDN